MTSDFSLRQLASTSQRAPNPNGVRLTPRSSYAASGRERRKGVSAPRRRAYPPESWALDVPAYGDPASTIFLRNPCQTKTTEPETACEKHALKSSCYRPFAAYGEDQDDTCTFPSVIKRALANIGAKVLEVWGAGDQMRDFIHSEDCVDGVLATLDKIHDGDALNLSTGIYTSFKEFARMAAECCGYSPEVVGLSDSQPACLRAGEIRRSRSRWRSGVRSRSKTGLWERSPISNRGLWWPRASHGISSSCRPEPRSSA